MSAPRYRLGAEELIELGDSESKVMLKNRKPFLAGRAFKLGQSEGEESILDVISSAGKWVADTLSYVLHTLAGVLDVPLAAIAQSADVVFNSISDLLKKVPVLGNLLAEILLLGGALVKFGLSLPGLALSGLGNLIAGMARALDHQSDKAENQVKLDTARAQILELAPSELKTRIEKLFTAIGITGNNLSPDVLSNGKAKAAPAGTSLSGSPPPPEPARDGLRNALTVGVPVLGAVALAAVFGGK